MTIGQLKKIIATLPDDGKVAVCAGDKYDCCVVKYLIMAVGAGIVLDGAEDDHNVWECSEHDSARQIGRVSSSDPT